MTHFVHRFYRSSVGARHLTLVICSASFAFYSSCKEQPPSARVKIDSGESINSTSSNKVEGVFYSMTTMSGSSSGNACTGTAVSTNTAITAAHCVAERGNQVDKDTGKVAGKEYCINNAIYKKVCSKEVYAHPNYLKLESQDGKGTDFAWIVFPAGTFKYVFSMNTGSVQVGDQVVLVGYSEDNLADRSKGSKRFGWNSVSRLLESDRSDIFTDYGRKFEKVAVSPGDSGGPLLKNCQVTGVASRMTEGGSKQSIHTNLTHQETVNTLKQAVGGAYFCGLTGNDPNMCPPDHLYAPKANVTSASKEFPCTVSAAVQTPTPEGGSAAAPDSSATPGQDSSVIPVPVPSVAPAPEAILDCNKDYGKIHKGGQGICLNRSSGNCYKYSANDVQYGNGRVQCPSS